MNDGLFNLDFNQWGEFLLIIPALINVGIFIYAVFFLPQNKTNKAFFLFVLLLGIAQTVNGLMRLSVSEETALLWCRMSTSSYLLAVSFGLLFALRFTGWNKKIGDSKLLAFLFLPTILFEFQVIAHLDKYKIVKSARWNWIANPESTLITNSIFLWMSGIGLIILGLLWFYYFKKSEADQKRIQALLLAVGFTVPFVGGITTEVIFPLVFNLDGIPLSTPLITVFSITSLIAVIRYNLLDYSPKHQWDTIVETMNDGIAIVNNNCQIMYANKLFCKQAEYEFKEIKGKPIYELFSDEFEKEKLIETLFKECTGKMLSQSEIKLRTKSGKSIWVLITRSPYLSSMGEIIGLILQFKDITERKKAEEHLYQSELRLKNFIEDSLLGIYFYNVDTKKIIYANTAFFRLIGYLPEEIDSLTIYDFVNHPKESIDSFINQTIQAKQNKIGEREWKRKDGKLLQVFVNASYINSNNSEIVYITAQDITERKRTEDMLKATNEELETFIYKASHDLRAPLASIMGLINVSKIDVEDKKSMQYLNMIDTSTKKLDNILKGLVQSMNIKDAKNMDEEIDFNQMIAETLEKFEHYEGYSRIIISCSVTVEYPFYSSRFIMESIFQNMIENAIKYQNNNLKEPFLKIAIIENKRSIQVIFEDNGIGIDPSFHNEIFGMYFKAHSTSKGSGLGLYLVSNGIKKLNGSIEIESVKGKGTKFIFSIPKTHVESYSYENYAK